MSDRYAGLDEGLDAVLEEAFEGMAFTAIERAPDAVFEWEGRDLFWASVAAIDPPVGELTLVLPSAMARDIAQSVVGDDGAPGDPLVLDVLGELTNTVAGSWLRSLQSEGHTVAMGLPKTGHGDSGICASACEIAIYETDGALFGVALRREAADPEHTPAS